MKPIYGKIIAVAVAIVVGIYARNHFFGSEESSRAPVDPAQTQSLSQEQGVWVNFEGPIFGTAYHITYQADKEQTAQQLEQVKPQVEQLLQDFNSEFSTYDPNSVISQFNNFKEVDTKFPVSERYATVVKKATEIHDLTNGYYDITIFPLVKAWGFGPGKAMPNLSEDQVKALKENVGNNKYSLVEEAGKYYLVKHNPEITHDMSSIAKGYAVDLVAQLLRAQGITNYLVEIGGEVDANGLNDQGEPWKLAIQEPNFEGTTDINTIISVNNAAVATSGNYRNFRFENGRRITHEINPFTGYPIEHNTASLTVIADDCMTADALATGLYVLGADKALEIANKNNIAIFVIEFQDGKFITRISEAFPKKVKILERK